MPSASPKNASLTLVGTGIKFLSHLTTEAKAHIEQADCVLYLVNEPAMKAWIEETNRNAEALDFLYAKQGSRTESYQQITRYIVDIVKSEQHVCVALYGHPTVFAQPALHAAEETRKLGIETRILPGISAEDCLFADLGINPGSGCLSLEATDLLIHDRLIDPTCHVILWQIGLTGIITHTENPDPKPGLALLADQLKKTYSENHPITLYVAAQYPSFEPQTIELTLNELADSHPPRLATLYIPPAKAVNANQRIIEQLGLA